MSIKYIRIKYCFRFINKVANPTNGYCTMCDKKHGFFFTKHFYNPCKFTSMPSEYYYISIYLTVVVI